MSVTKVRRYSICPANFGLDIQFSPDGDWVKWEDVRTLIEQKPRVSNELIEKYARKFGWKIGDYESVIGLESAKIILTEMFQEANIEVSDE